MDSASGHFYITFDIQLNPPEKDLSPRNSKAHHKGWKMNEAVLIKLNNFFKHKSPQTINTSKELTTYTTLICDTKFQKRKPYSFNHMEAYLWTEEISKIRKECNFLRR